MTTSYLTAFFSSLLITYVLVPVVKKAAPKIGALDLPDERRLNTEAIPNIGGLAIYLGFMVAVLLTAEISPVFKGIMFGGTFILFVGFVDDLYEISPFWKLMGQIIAAIILILYGVQIEFITNPMGGLLYLGYWSVPITILWVVSITNTLNLIDGLDGLATGITVIAVFTLFFVSLQEGQPNSAILALSLAGAAFGFLKYNFPPAELFMGDSGAMFMGFVLAAISIAGALKSAATVTLVVPLLALGVPIFDTLFAIIRRLYNGKPIGKADQGHIHHRLLALGWSQEEAVLIVYVISFLLGLTALAINGTSFGNSLVLIIVVFGLLVYAAWKIGIFDVELSPEGKTVEESKF
ncbi:MAG: glycosyltransferase family 4 protein [Halanaerobiales bacterium]